MLPEVPFPVYFHFFFFKSNVISDFILSYQTERMRVVNFYFHKEYNTIYK